MRVKILKNTDWCIDGIGPVVTLSRDQIVDDLSLKTKSELVESGVAEVCAEEKPAESDIKNENKPRRGRKKNRDK